MTAVHRPLRELIGETIDAVEMHAIELHAEGSGSAIDEAAILFANGLIEPAEAGLRAAIHSDSLGDSAQRAWLMLFELFQQRGDKGSR